MNYFKCKISIKIYFLCAPRFTRASTLPRRALVSKPMRVPREGGGRIKTRSPCSKQGDTKPRYSRCRDRDRTTRVAERCESRFYLRPVDGRGLLPIALNVAETKVIGHDEVFGAAKKHVLKQHLEVTVDAETLRLRVKASFGPVFFKDCRGHLKRIKHSREAVLKQGHVLYMNLIQGVPTYGYVLSDNMHAPVAKEVIEIMDDGSIPVVVASSDSAEEPDPVEKSWDIIETRDLEQLHMKELYTIAVVLNIDISSCLEKSEVVAAVSELKGIGRLEWLSRKRNAEEALIAEEKKKNEEKKRMRQKQKAFEKMQSLTKLADLKVFLRRIKLKFDSRARCNKSDLKRVYFEALKKYHPDKNSGQSYYDQILGEEITKWMTEKWKLLRD